MSTQPTQPEALRLADWLQAAVQIYQQRSEDDPGGYASEVDQVMDEAASELLRLHDENAQLREQNTALDAACAKLEAVRGTPATGGGPVAWRYQDARGHYRYRGYVPRFDKDYAILKPIPLYTSPQPVREPVSFTKAQQERLYRNRPANVGKSTSLADWCRTVEYIEAAHGITGGKT